MNLPWATKNRLPIPVSPLADESLVGFLIRATESNFLRSPTTVLEAVTRGDNRPPVWQEIDALAAYCGCEADTLVTLFGFLVKTFSGERGWMIGSELITKPYFISSRNLSFCPECLAERQVLRAAWELTGYRVCPIHAIRLQNRCPVCKKLTTWRRGKIANCPCGGCLWEAPRIPGSWQAIVLANVIESRLSSQWPHPLPEMLQFPLLLHLDEIALDDLFKVIWLCGWLLDSTGPMGLNGKTRKPGDMDGAIDSACNCLSDWPTAFYRRLDEFFEPEPDRRLPLLGHSGSIYRYVANIKGEGASFLRTAYESHMQRLLRRAGRPRRRRVGEQLEFRFEER